MKIFDFWLRYQSIDELQCGLQPNSCLVVNDIGPYKSGSFLPCVAFDFEKATIAVYGDADSATSGKPTWESSFFISIGSK